MESKRWKWWLIPMAPIGAFCLCLVFIGACGEVVFKQIYGENCEDW